MKVLRYVFCLVALTVLGSSCAADRFALRTNDAMEGSIVVENKAVPGQLIIIVKSQHALDSTLNKLQCKKKPCMIGRIGEVYIVDRPKTD